MSSSPPPIASTSAPVVLSKKQQKKAAKRAAYEADKPARRAREKEARRQKNALKRAAGQPIHPNKRRKSSSDVALSKKPVFDCTIGVDLGGWDALMSEREVVSMTSQLCYCYNIARHALHRFKTRVFQLEGRIGERMGPEGALKGAHETWGKQADIEFTEASLLQDSQTDLKQVVYLTADSDNVLEQLEEGHVYVLGGIVDKNRYKVRPPLLTFL